LTTPRSKQLLTPLLTSLEAALSPAADPNRSRSCGAALIFAAFLPFALGIMRNCFPKMLTE
jgi:hypothetical protein